ncbi:MAG TPA: formimidoylglutamase [Aequorivita sp.]|jgi:formiminoglutamase|nr:arginase [Aequorivita sp.]MBP42187.1 arginase [Aequorivita sp.]HBC04336.1 arginase [Aequorivita sp.]HNP68824.1 formimidoylglutamase [Aequorivita sp.]|tara:strand:- start:62628 stop:63629 length:1002 start_codon:yes stop_codon:yes gene_type:complete
MSLLKIYSEKNVASFLKKRAGETKFGEKVNFVETLEDIKNHPAKYVLLGIPEDIGVRANYGNPGTSKAWEAALGSLLNIQHNHLTNPENVILLGEIDCDTQMKQAENISKEENHYAEELGELVTQIDHKVSEIIKTVVEAGKFPIIIGGGHNNSFGNLKGTSEALQKPINCVNFDAHTDFRALEHRHSGNGFSYAFEEGFLDKYFIFGLHRNYTSEAVFNTIEKNSERVKFNLFEDISVKQKLSFSDAMKDSENFCCKNNFGIELDMDAIEFMGSSAISPSGFTLTEARQFVSYFSKIENASYLHICEGSPSAGIFTNQVGKAIAYLVSDVIS